MNHEVPGYNSTSPASPASPSSPASLTSLAAGGGNEVLNLGDPTGDPTGEPTDSPVPPLPPGTYTLPVFVSFAIGYTSKITLPKSFLRFDDLGPLHLDCKGSLWSLLNQPI